MKAKIFVTEAGGFASTLYKEAFGDFEFFLFGVTCKTQNFHAILQRLWNRVKDVGSANEHHLGQIIFDVKVVIREGVI